MAIDCAYILNKVHYARLEIRFPINRVRLTCHKLISSIVHHVSLTGLEP